MDEKIMREFPDELECERLSDRYHEVLNELQKVQAMAKEVMHKSQLQLARAEITLREASKALIRELSYYLSPNDLEELGGWLIDESGKGQRPEERWRQHTGN